MADDVRHALDQMIRQYGHSIVEDARRCESILHDLCPESRREVFILSSAIRERVPAELLGSQSTVPYPVLSARLAERLETNLGLSQVFAAWAVEIWSFCLGVGGGAATSVGRCDSYFDSQVKAVDSHSLSRNHWQSSNSTLCTVTVSSRGRGHYSAISRALAEASPGTRILVSPGVYRETLIIDKPVEIIGDGNLKDIVVSSDDRPCLMMDADYAIVRGITFRGTGHHGAEEIPAVVAGCGQLIMEECDITCSSSHCILIGSKGADPVVRRCSIHNSSASGVRVCKNALGTLEKCDIWANARSGVDVSVGGNPTIKDCKIHNNNAHGVSVDEDGFGTLDSCDIWTNSLSGVRISRGSNPTIKDCKIHENKGAGVHVYGGGSGTFTRCETWGNANCGVHVQYGGKPVFIDCTHHDEKRLQ